MAIQDDLANVVNEFFKIVPPEILTAFLIGLVAGYLIGKYFGEDMGESDVYNYLTGRTRLRE